MARITTVALFLLLVASAAVAQPASEKSSSERLRDNPTAKYLLVKTVVGQSLATVDGRALPVEPAGYNLLKYCWTPANVLGDWGERAGVAGQMITRAVETSAWVRDLARAGYRTEPVNGAIGRYEAALIAADFADAARARALEALVTELEALRRSAPGAAEINAIYRCDRQARSLALNIATLPEGGSARFIPVVLHRLCEAQQLDADDPARCDYWMAEKTDGPMSFAGETVYQARWPDGTVATGRFDPEAQRSAGIVTLRRRGAQPAATK